MDQVCKDHHCCWCYIRRRSMNWLLVRRRPRSRDGCVFQRVAGRPSHRRVLTKPLVQMVQCSNCTSGMFWLQSCSQTLLMQCCALPYLIYCTCHGTQKPVQCSRYSGYVGTGWSGDWIQVRAINVFFSKMVQTGDHPASCSIGIGVKRPGCEVGHLSVSSGQDKNEWRCASMPSYSGQHNFTFCQNTTSV